jgi:hypothetical protein
MPGSLTVLAALRPGEEVPLRRVLRAIGDDIQGKALGAPVTRPHIDFSRARTVHFARFAILDDPDRGPSRKRLLFASAFDGDLDGHLRELIDVTSDMNAVWGGCEGYTGVPGFPAFIRARAHEPRAFYMAFRDETAEGIRSAAAARRQARALMDAAPASALATLMSREAGDRTWAMRVAAAVAEAARRVMQGGGRVLRALPLVVDVVRAIRQSGFVQVYLGTNRLIASLDRYPIFRIANWLTSNRLPPRISPYSSVALDNCSAPGPLGPGDEVPSDLGVTPPTFREDVVAQNQLTLVTVIDPRHLARVYAVLAAIDSFAKRLAPPGSLIGISTIHFVRWLVIDQGRRLVMVSDYDGSWESYIDEFAEMILSGLDAIWETAYGYPRDGARDVPALKRFLRAHQIPAELFFSGYPDLTVLNIANDLELARARTESSDRVRRLLQRI